MVKKLDWDSDFFGYNIGRLDVNKQTIFNFKILTDKKLPFKLIYVFSEDELDYEGLDLIDSKVTFSAEITKTDKFIHNKIGLFNCEKDNFRTLESLALESGVCSRFRKDKNFTNNEYERLYKKWVYNSVFENKLSEVLIYQEKGEILGFASLTKKNENLCDIGLVAVDKKARGKEIGTKLIQSSKNLAFTHGYKEIQVVTQFNNDPAMKLYQKCGFNISKTEYIYHYWNL